MRNVLVKSLIGIGILCIGLIACNTGSGISTPISAAVTIAGAPATGKLKIGADTQLTATATDGNGSAMSGETFTWVSSNPAAVSVSASGVAKALALTPANAPVTITATSSNGRTGAIANLLTYGVEITVGTYKFKTNAPRVMLFVKARRADGTPPIPDAAVTVIGPTGWNGGATAKIYTNAFIQKYTTFIENTAVSGTYSFSSVLDGETFNSQATLNSAQVLPEPTGLSLTIPTVNSATASWTAVLGAQSYFAFACPLTTGNCNFIGQTTGTTVTSTNMNLQPNTNYKLRVSAYNYDETSDDPPTPATPLFSATDDLSTSVLSPSLGGTPKISGKIVNWKTSNYTTGTIRFSAQNSSNTSVGTGNIDSQGFFSVALSVPPASALMDFPAGPLGVSQGCAAGSTATSSNALSTAGANAEVLNSSGVIAGGAGLANSIAALGLIQGSFVVIGQKVSSLLYSTAATTLSGVCNSSGGQSGTYDATLDIGWNYVTVTATSSSTVTFTSGAISNDMQWYYTGLISILRHPLVRVPR